jgi:hypothetical protein
MANTVSIEIQMADILDEVKKSCKGVLETQSLAVAKETVTKIRNASPHLTGSYARGWRVSKRGGGFVVHNATDYQLTHLLENSHVIANGSGTYGRTTPIKHIEPAGQWASEELPRRIIEELNL